MSKSKIFGIGLAKTGTTSLNDAFAILGIASIGCPADIASIRRFDAATDGIVADQFEELDRVFPGSKFVYTVRDVEDWLDSYTRYRGWKLPASKAHTEKVERLYGTTGTDRSALRESHERHDRHVREYFRDRPEDLLIMNICDGGADWPSLCGFLGRPVPEIPFPASNERFTNNVFLHLLYHLQDPALVSKISRAPVDYLARLSTDTYQPENFINESPSKRSDRILVKSCKHFGGVAHAADRLKLDEQFLEAAIERHRQRKSPRPKRKSTVISKRIRRLRHLLGLRTR
ncbi:MAG: sulfotransferase [Chromatiaceae bacterium]|jgi:hypothetical protein